MLAASACSNERGDGSAEAPPPSGRGRPAGTAPTPADVPAKYVLSTYAASLWRPERRPPCAGHLAPQRRERLRRARFLVYFSCQAQRGPLIAAGAARPLGRTDASPERALRILFRGPTGAERKAGYVSNFGPARARLAFTVAIDRRHDLAVVDLDRRFLDVEFAFVSVQDVAQIVSTAGQFDRLEWVAILVDGRPLCKALSEC